MSSSSSIHWRQWPGCASCSSRRRVFGDRSPSPSGRRFLTENRRRSPSWGNSEGSGINGMRGPRGRQGRAGAPSGPARPADPGAQPPSGRGPGRRPGGPAPAGPLTRSRASFTTSGRPPRDRPFSASVALAACSSVAKETKPNPRGRAVSRSTTMCTSATSPYGENSARISSAVVENGRFPTKRRLPMRTFSRSPGAVEHRVCRARPPCRRGSNPRA